MARKWTDQEKNYLDKFFEKKGVPYLADKLGRSTNAVKKMAHDLGHNAMICEDLYERTLAECFGTYSKVVRNWIEKYGLKCTKVKRGNRIYRLIAVKDFWEWAETHKNLIPFHKYVRLSVIPEPDWLKDCIKNYDYPVNNRKPITSSDKFAVKMLSYKGYSESEIAKEINRTPDSVHYIKKLIREEERRNGYADHRANSGESDKHKGHS